MTRNELAKMTVPELRAMCGDCSLPKYQHRGRRLRKADLVAQLLDVIEPTYQLLPKTELVVVGNGARKWRYTDHGDRVLSTAYISYDVLRVIGT